MAGAVCLSLGHSPSPRCPHTPESPPPLVPRGEEAKEGPTCCSLRLQPLHPLLQLLDVRLEVSVPGISLPELTEGR